LNNFFDRGEKGFELKSCKGKMIDFNPGVSQRHLLFFLLFTGEEPAMSKTTPALNIKQRRELV
jgi:hypothetical protein